MSKQFCEQDVILEVRARTGIGVPSQKFCCRVYVGSSLMFLTITMEILEWQSGKRLNCCGIGSTSLNVEAIIEYPNCWYASL